jgi:hypothetical protein
MTQNDLSDKLTEGSGDLSLTGICCIHIDENTDDSKIQTVYRTMETIKNATKTRVFTKKSYTAWDLILQNEIRRRQK